MAKKHFFLSLTKKLPLIAILLLTYAGIALAAERYAVTAKLINIRSGPGTNYDILWKAEKYYPIDVIKKSGKWYKFKDFEGDIGWVYKSLVRKISAVITIKDKCNIRSGPGRKYNVLLISEKGVPFKVIKRQGSWINVQHSDGHEGWLHKSLVW